MNNLKSQKIILLLFFMIVASFLWATNVVLADDFPPLGPPGVYNVEPPCNESGCRFNSNALVTFDAPAGSDCSDTELSAESLVWGCDQSSSYVPNQDLTIVELNEDCVSSYDSGVDQCWEIVEYIQPHSKNVSFFNQRIYADGGISVAPGMNISLPGPNGVEIKDTLNGWYGFGFHARSSQPKTNVPESNPSFRNFNPAIWGQAFSRDDYGSTILDLFYNAGEWTGMPDKMNSEEMNFGVMGQGLGNRSVGVYGKAHNGAIAGFFSGGLMVDSIYSLTTNIYATAITPTDDLGLHIHVRALGSDITYRPIEISTLQPDKVFFGGTMPNGEVTPDVQLCLNDPGDYSSCISSWPQAKEDTDLTLQDVTSAGSTTDKEITVGELCIDGTCITKEDLENLKDLIK